MKHRLQFAEFAAGTALGCALCLGVLQDAAAQYAGGSPPPWQEQRGISAEEQRARGIARCRENRGVDCDSPQGQKEWVLQERPITDAERTEAAAARRAREAREAREASRRR